MKNTVNSSTNAPSNGLVCKSMDDFRREQDGYAYPVELFEDFWLDKQISFGFASLQSNYRVLAYQLAQSLAYKKDEGGFVNEKEAHKVLLVDFCNDSNSFNGHLYNCFGDYNTEENSDNLVIACLDEHSKLNLMHDFIQCQLRELVELHQPESVILCGIDYSVNLVRYSKVYLTNFYRSLVGLKQEFDLSILVFAEIPEQSITKFNLDYLPRTPFTGMFNKLNNVFVVKSMDNVMKQVVIKVLKTQNPNVDTMMSRVAVLRNEVYPFYFEKSRAIAVDSDCLNIEVPPSLSQKLLLNDRSNHPEMSLAQLATRNRVSKSFVFRTIKKFGAGFESEDGNWG